MAKYKLTRKAVEDLSIIWEYTYDNWSENQADKYYRLLIEGFEEIAKRPEIGRSYSQIYDGLLGLKIGRHMVFYRHIGKMKIEIVRILHEQMDLKNRIEEE
jgi:toxin ParE1/3/4